MNLFLSILGAAAMAVIALYRNEPVNALWILTAAVCVYLLGYRFYLAWIAAKVLSVNPLRATPAVSLVVASSQHSDDFAFHAPGQLLEGRGCRRKHG